MNNKEKKIPNIKNLLVVDDDQRIRDLLKEYLDDFSIQPKISEAVSSSTSPVSSQP